MRGRVYGASCSLARSSLNQPASCVTRSPASRRITTSSASSIITRVFSGWMPSCAQSDGSAPGPTPNIDRPRVMWSSCTNVSATMNGLWKGRDLTPAPSRMRRVRWAAAAIITSGAPDISNPPEWCSPNHTSSKPRRSKCSTSSRSRSKNSVGFSFIGWKGA